MPPLVNGSLDVTNNPMENGDIYMSEKTSLKHVVNDGTGKTIKVRSNLEVKLAAILNDTHKAWEYEVTTIPYTVPESHHKYTVDFTLLNGILIEGKGYLSDHQERHKYVLLKQQYPDLDLRFVFDNPNKLCGGTKYSHAKWADKFGFRWCSIKDVEQIQSWLNEGK